MGFHGRILECGYDDAAREAYVTKSSKWGTFTCKAHVSDKDLDVANKWDGQKFADVKCDIAAAKEKAKAMRERFNGARHVYDVLYMSGKLPDDVEKAMYRQVVIAEEQYEDALKKYREMREGYRRYTELTLKVRRSVRSKQALEEE